MGNCIKPNSVFGADKYIKFGNGQVCAIEGPSTLFCSNLSSIRSPYAQALSGKIILKPGQTDYLLNHLGLGDNVTYLLIKSNFDKSSRDEEENYVYYRYANDINKTKFTFAQVMILTGNSTHRIPQLYLTNPNTKHSVTLDIMVGIIDDNDSFYTSPEGSLGELGADVLLPREGCMLYTQIVTWIVSETIAITNYDNDPISFIQIENINGLSRESNIVYIDDRSAGKIALNFCDEFNAIQGLSILSWVTENPDKSIQEELGGDDGITDTDLLDPTIYFTDKVEFIGAPLPSPAPVPSSTQCQGSHSDDGDDFVSTSLSLANYNGVISKTDLMDALICQIVDNRDGIMELDLHQFIIEDIGDNRFNTIVTPTTYIITFNLNDIAENTLSVGLNIVIEITT
jgi:hypothetical protein